MPRVARAVFAGIPREKGSVPFYLEIYTGISSSGELGKMDRFLRKLGFQCTGGNYSLQLGGNPA